MNNNCTFCNLDNTKIYNKIIEETNNFIVLPALGSLVDGYILIITKNHFYNMLELSKVLKEEYLKLIKKYQNLFFEIYGKQPIVFEHGTSRNTNKLSSSSIIHAHTHIVNHNYFNEPSILKELNLKEITFLNHTFTKKNYIFYISPNNKIYISYNFNPISQIMRIHIAKDLNIENKFNWRNEPFLENINSTIKKFNNNKNNHCTQKIFSY